LPQLASPRPTTSSPLSSTFSAVDGTTRASETADVKGRVRRLLDAEAAAQQLQRRSDDQRRHQGRVDAFFDDDDDDDPSSSSLPLLPNVYELRTVQDYKKLVEDCGGALTVVHFSGPSFCLACKAALPAVVKMARDMPDVNFAVLLVTKDNHRGVRELGVPSLPYGHVHHPRAGLVERLSNNRRHLADFSRVVESYRSLRCPLPDEKDDDGGGGAEAGSTPVFASPYVRAA
jgi:hypothetical protein